MKENDYLVVYDAGRHDAELPKYFWHTGTPTEEGWYICAVKITDKVSYESTVWKNDGFLWDFASVDLSQFVIAWHRIPDYDDSPLDSE